MGDIAVMKTWEARHWIWAASLTTVELSTAVAVQMYSLSLILPEVYKAHNYGIGNNNLVLVF